MLNLFLPFTITFSFYFLAVFADITTLVQLNYEIDNGLNKNVGFLSLGNYNAVKGILSTNVEVNVIGSADLLDLLVNNGTVLAGLVSQSPEGNFHQFSSNVLSPQGMLLRKESDILAKVLSKFLHFYVFLLYSCESIIDAAIVRVVANSGPFNFSTNNPPTKVIQINTCNFDPTLYNFPPIENVSSESWYISGYLQIGSLGPYNWDNAGNYLVNPPVGFWPEYYSKLYK